MDQESLFRALFLIVPCILAWLIILPLRKVWRVPLAVVLGIAVAFVLTEWLSRGNLSFLVDFSIMASLYAILALGLNSQCGYNGHLNFGVVGFFMVGAFTTALFTSAMPTGLMASYEQQAFGLQLPFIVGVIAAAVISGVVGFLVAIPVLRLRTDFLAIATLGIALIIRLIFQNERWLANGPQPMRGIPQPLACLFDHPVDCGSWVPQSVAAFFNPMQPRDYIFLYLVIVALFLAFCYIALETALRSPWGRVLRAVRDEENSAAMSGKYVTSYRVQAFVVGSVVMGIGGALYAHYVTSIDYSHFKPLFGTFIVWVMLMFGGSGNNKGALLGAFVVWGVWVGTSFLANGLHPVLSVISPTLAGRTNYIRWLLVGILLLVIVLFRPHGIIKEEKFVSNFLKRRQRD
jgi:branched-chain amino acid transport system permease protein